MSGDGTIDERIARTRARRSVLPGSIAVAEAMGEAEAINGALSSMEINTAKVAASWDGELDVMGDHTQLAYLHEKAELVESAARRLREAIERLTGWGE